MYADRIEIFHGADGDDVALAVTDHLKLDFFPAADALFDQNLCDRRKTQTVLGDVAEHFFIVCDTAACAAQCICRTQYNRITDFSCKCFTVFYIINN